MKPSFCTSPFARFPVLASFAASLALAGCTQPTGAADDDTSANDESAIVGGKKVTSQDPIAKVAVAIVDAEVGEYCTGVVLDSFHVVTASHCFDDISRTPTVRVGAGNGGKLLAVRSVAVHAKSDQARREAYDASIEEAVSADTVPTPSAPLYDVAVLELAERLPSSVTPATFAPPDADLANEALVSAGYGCTSTACTGTGDTLRKVDTQFVSAAPEANVVVLRAGKRKGTCAGDSGGPDFLVTPSGAVEVFALVMTGPAACEAGISVDTLVAPYLRWMRSTAATMGDGRSTSRYRLTRY